jgi:hypothetical protein
MVDEGTGGCTLFVPPTDTPWVGVPFRLEVLSVGGVDGVVEGFEASQ